VAQPDSKVKASAKAHVEAVAIVDRRARPLTDFLADPLAHVKAEVEAVAETDKCAVLDVGDVGDVVKLGKKVLRAGYADEGTLPAAWHRSISLPEQ